MIKAEGNFYQDEGAVNIRDLNRFLKLYESSILQSIDHDNSFIHAFELCYLSRIGKKKDLAIKAFLNSGLTSTNSL